ncbi:MAG: hypothetical protein FIA99_12340 [Ruminiclostridium sp.]|nr:hypothetical protein [Ruminiclostridium sp.]
MSEIRIKQAKTEGIPVIEDILFDTVNWLNEMEQPLWGAGEVSWDALSKSYQIGDFYIDELHLFPDLTKMCAKFQVMRKYLGIKNNLPAKIVQIFN